MITVCCVCQKTKRDKGWYITTQAKNVVVSHGYCPDCFANLQIKMFAVSKVHR